MKLKTTKTPHIAVVGGADLEFGHSLPHMPSPGESIYAGHVGTRPGGRGADISMALCALGARVFLFSCVGLDSYGASIMGGLRKNRINVDFMQRCDEPTGLVHNLYDPQGNRIRIIAPGASQHMTTKPIHAGQAMISACQLMIITSEVPPSVFEFSIKVAHHFNVPILAVPSPANRFNTDWIAQCDILLAAHGDAQVITGTAPDSLDKADDTLNFFLKKGCGAAVMHMGRHGAIASEAVRQSVFYPGPVFKGNPAPEAEDIFIAAFAASMCSELSIGEACTRAVAAAWYTNTGIAEGNHFPSENDISAALAV